LQRGEQLNSDADRPVRPIERIGGRAAGRRVVAFGHPFRTPSGVL